MSFNKKVLCIGNNLSDTDAQVFQLAKTSESTNHGLISDTSSIPENNGYYHSSLYDIDFKNLLNLSQYFDEIVILDQPASSWDDNFTFNKTILLANEIEKTKSVIWKNTDLENNPNKIFQEILKKNKSFCILPFIGFSPLNGNTTVCSRSSTPITKIDDIKNWATDPDYLNIREKMIAGIKQPTHCNICYEYEDQGIISPRQTETLEWVDKLKITSIEELTNINNPVYYEIRTSNICNLQCRMCLPKSSNLIEKEYKILGLHDNSKKYKYDTFNFIALDSLQQLYVAGGEPTAQFELYDFLEKCIANNKTDFQFCINTNLTKISGRLRHLLKQFSNLNLIVSLDGFDKINHNVRWPSNWVDIMQNLNDVCDDGHHISFHLVLSIYNISNSYALLEFLDTNYSTKSLSIGMVLYPDLIEKEYKLFGLSDNILDPYLFPDKELALNNLQKITKLTCYNDLVIKSIIDKSIDFFKQNNDIDTVRLRKFFEFNDLLDQSRNIQLKDYIPELEECRRYVL
jgi:hypothetical protein